MRKGAKGKGATDRGRIEGMGVQREVSKRLFGTKGGRD